MSTWSTPYLKVWDAAGVEVDWQLPHPLPWPAGASTDADLRTPVELGLPVGGTIQVRWRTPSHANPRGRKRPTSDLRTVALACDVQRAAAARGHGWQADAAGWPRVVSPEPRVPAALLEQPAPATPPAPPEQDLAPLVGAWSRVSPGNAVLAAVRSGQIQLGATVAQVITAIRRDREAGWSTTHEVNMTNVLGFIEQLLVYEEPVEDDTDADLPEVAAWMRARLALPGVRLGDSIHIALLLAPDLTLAIERRRYTDRRVERLNEQAVQRYLAQYQRYEQLMADRAARPRGGRAPKAPPAPVVRVPKLPCEPRTEELFATGLGMVLGYAEQSGLLVGPNPWPAFIGRGRTKTGFRRSELVPPHRRTVPPVGMVLALADAVAALGPLDRRTGRPTGERFRAMVLALLTGVRPSEVDALSPGDFVLEPQPALLVSKSASIVPKAAAKGDSTFEVRPFGKTGEARIAPMSSFVADALRQHVKAGYASDHYLFTGPDGGPVRWGNLLDAYWRPAVTQVFGASQEPLLRDMPRKWLRKAAITWMLRAGLGVEQVSQITGHDVVTLYHHYAGVVAGYSERHTWTDWDTAWAWAVQEKTLP